MDTTFGEDQVLVRKRFMNQFDVLEHRLATAPGFIPVETYTPYKFCGVRVGENSAGTLINQIAVMVPGDDVLVCESVALERWSKIVLQEVALLFSRVDT